MIQQCALNAGFFFKWWQADSNNRSRVQVSVHQVWVVHNCVSLYTIARGTIANSEASAVTSPAPMKLGKSNKYGFIAGTCIISMVIDLELGIFLNMHVYIGN